MIAEEFKKLPDDRRIRALNLAINCHGRLKIISRNDAAKYYGGQKMVSRYPVHLMESIIEKTKLI